MGTRVHTARGLMERAARDKRIRLQHKAGAGRSLFIDAATFASWLEEKQYDEDAAKVRALLCS